MISLVAILTITLSQTSNIYDNDCDMNLHDIVHCWKCGALFCLYFQAIFDRFLCKKKKITKENFY